MKILSKYSLILKNIKIFCMLLIFMLKKNFFVLRFIFHLNLNFRRIILNFLLLKFIIFWMYSHHHRIFCSILNILTDVEIDEEVQT